LFNKKKNNPARSIALDDLFHYFSSLQDDLDTENDLESDTVYNDNDVNLAELDCPNNSCTGNNLINEYFIQTVF
jgi:hypothetical protein